MLNTTPYTAFALLVALPASAQAQILTFNPTEANAAVVEADLNAQTSGGSWTISAAGMDQFVFLNDGAGGTDYAYLFRDSSASNPFPNGNYSQVTLTTPVDFTVQPIVVSADMAYTDTNGGQTRPWSMIGFSVPRRFSDSIGRSPRPTTILLASSELAPMRTLPTTWEPSPSRSWAPPSMNLRIWRLSR